MRQQLASLISVVGLAVGGVFAVGLVCSEQTRAEEILAAGSLDAAPALDEVIELCGFGRDSAGSGHWLENLSLFGGIEGSKQPQDFGVNANLGGRFHANWGAPLLPDYGIGMQLGTALVASDNAVRVYELLGEVGGRRQSFTTAGLFQRFENGWSWGLGYDFLYEESFDDFFLGQWRIRTAYDLSRDWQLGMTVNIAAEDDEGQFNATTVTLDPITQAHWYLRRNWQSGTQTTLWVGLAEGHGENNAVTGPSGSKDEVFLLGADFLAPLNNHLALYGESNLIMPADTGTVDAFLGVQWFPWGNAKRARRNGFSPLLPVAGSPTFSVDLHQ